MKPHHRSLCALISFSALLILTAASAAAAPGFAAYWVQNHVETTVWSGPDQRAIAFGVAPQWSYFQVVAAQHAPRLLVLVAATGNYAWIDAAAVGPSGPPPAPEPAAPEPEPEPAPIPEPAPEGLPLLPVEQPAYRPFWVATHMATDLWSGADAGAKSKGRTEAGEYFLVMTPQTGPRLDVLVRSTRERAWIDALAVGPIPPPPVAELPANGWKGVITAEVANVRPEPHTWIAPIGQLQTGDEVTVEAWVEGDEVVKEQPVWAKLGEGQYIWSGLLMRVGPREPAELLAAAPPLPEGLEPRTGRWLDVNLSAQVLTAYESDRPVYAALISSGRAGWATSTGTFRITRRVEKETMDSTTLLALDAVSQRRADYRVENVRWTQYFTADGQAIHENYWRSPDLFGIPSSHGCLGLLARDAEWLWKWADLSTVLEIHY